MQKSKHDVWVGLFVLLGAAAILFLALKGGSGATWNADGYNHIGLINCAVAPLFTMQDIFRALFPDSRNAVLFMVGGTSLAGQSVRPQVPRPRLPHRAPAGDPAHHRRPPR